MINTFFLTHIEKGVGLRIQQIARWNGEAFSVGVKSAYYICLPITTLEKQTSTTSMYQLVEVKISTTVKR